MLHTENLELYAKLFANRTDTWFRQWIDNEGRCQYPCVKPGSKYYEPVSADLIHRHLIGTVTASWPALNQSGQCKWLCWDNDIENGAIPAIAEVLNKLGLPSYREAIRPGREGHLWLFLDEPIAAADAVLVGPEIVEQSGFEIKSREKPDGVEFFPKTKSGFSQVRGPLGVHRKPGANNIRGWFADAEPTMEAQLSFLEMVQLASSRRIARVANLLRSKKEGSEESVRKPTDLHQKAFRHRENILHLLPSVKRLGREYAAPCPKCREEGHDTSGDNLRITQDGKKFCCVYGSPGEIHKAAEIIAALSR